ncbi:MAG: efflux transporter outer membrane subunit [Verrucomicrobia bacterium]|nr:efflux transporter outer membrane subunit [Verrucomicrobiota bacterium]
MRYLFLLLFLSGCMVGPKYCKPEVEVAKEWGVDDTSDEPPLTDWWQVFDDPLLTKYIETGALYNRTLLMLEATILQARATRQVAASQLFPQVDLDLNGTRSYFSKNGPVFAIGNPTGSTTGSVSPNTGLPFVLQIPQIQNLYNALFDASWEIDLFGKTRSGVEAAAAMIESKCEEYNDRLLSLFAEIAKNYMELRKAQRMLHLVQEDIRMLEAYKEITALRYKTGLVSKMPEESVEGRLGEAKAKEAPIIAEIYRSIYTLSVLIGCMPEALVDELLVESSLPKRPYSVAMGVRSDLLRRRPDVRAVERKLKAATANIGVAVASFFPTITLIGDGGLQSLALKNLFTPKSKTWAFGADINTPLFQGGNLIGNLKLAKAQEAYAAYEYQEVVLEAFEEAEKALISYTQDVKRVEEELVVVKSYQNLAYLSFERNQKGLVNRLDLLDAKLAENSKEEALLQMELQALVDLIALYKALGGSF